MLHFSSRGEGWTCTEDGPHIAELEYDLAINLGDEDELETVGRVTGNRIAQDWTVNIRRAIRSPA